MDGIIRFKEFCYSKNIGKTVFNIANDNTNRLTFTSHDIKILKENCKINLLNNDSLIIGNPHSKGGIMMIIKLKRPFWKPLYFLHGEMEGNEYFAYTENDNNKQIKLTEINLRNRVSTNPNQTDYDKPFECNCNTIDAYIKDENHKFSILILKDLDFYIVNKISTRKHLDDILELIP